MSGSLLLTVGVGALGLGIGLLAIVFGSARSQRQSVAGALTSIERNYGQQPAAAQAQSADGMALPSWARSIGIRLSPSGIAATLQRRLDLAGNSPSWTADRILALKGLGLLVFAALGGLLGLHNLGLAVLFACVGGAAGFYLPDLLLYNAGIKRQALILAGLPDALDMLTVCVEAGLGFDAALAQVARNSGGPLAAEFARALQEMQIGLSRSQALRGMVSRTTVPELRAFVSALVQASELGIPVARVLREQALEMRVRRRQRAEERAQKVPVKIMFPLITCLFPALLVIVIGPGVISIAKSIFIGH
ncbi:MAG TPA: type II secretion system F family protein [Streptosporangiaceae bacterium]|nr:type II secretion system F family protein [Streptosporangiaceae bacterium]